MVLKETHLDRAIRIIQTYSQETAFAIEDNGQIPRLTLMALVKDRAIKHPWVPLADSSFGGRLDMDGDASIRWAGDLIQGSHV